MDARTPSPRLWLLRCLQVAIVALLAGGTFGAAAGVAGGIAAGLSVAGADVACALVALAFVRRRFRAWRYEERGEDLVVTRGVMFRRQSVVPYGRMQFIDVTAGPFERVFGLATVRLHTASPVSDARIPGVVSGEAARLRDRLAALGEARAAGL